MSFTNTTKVTTYGQSYTPFHITIFFVGQLTTRAKTILNPLVLLTTNSRCDCVWVTQCGGNVQT